MEHLICYNVGSYEKSYIKFNEHLHLEWNRRRYFLLLVRS